MRSEQEYLAKLLQPFPGINTGKIEQLYAYLKLVLEENQRTNLTAITDWEEAVVKHLYDSLFVTRWSRWTAALKIIDLGAGAGFPGIPLAILFPRQQYFLVEANKKKAEFLSSVKELLRLDNTFILNERAETIAHQQAHRSQYTIVTARAVASTAVLLELALPFCQQDGYFVAYKGKNYREELMAAQNAIGILGAVLSEEISYELPNGLGERNLLIFQKKHFTPAQYPRRPGIPAKRPL
ncbi:MAG TPA: 16S rRNA (guanine(527)-N(7))-methyltransferase RsmG [Bacillota bacterium]